MVIANEGEIVVFVGVFLGSDIDRISHTASFIFNFNNVFNANRASIVDEFVVVAVHNKEQVRATGKLLVTLKNFNGVMWSATSRNENEIIVQMH